MAIYKLSLPGRFPSLNEYINAERTNRFAAAKMKKEFSDLAFYCARSQLKSLKINSLVQICFHWFEPNKRRDLDNIAFGKKFIIDGLVKAGILNDDGQKNICGLSDKFDVDKPKTIMRLCGCKDDDIKILIAKHFIIPFESGIVVIRHWKVHNYIPKDRYKPTIYNTEKQLLKIETNGIYCIQTVSNMDTQDRLGKDRLDKDRLDKDNIKRKNIKKEISTESEALKEFEPPMDFNDLRNNALEAVRMRVD